MLSTLAEYRSKVFSDLPSGQDIVVGLGSPETVEEDSSKTLSNLSEYRAKIFSHLPSGQDINVGIGTSDMPVSTIEEISLVPVDDADKSMESKKME